MAKYLEGQPAFVPAQPVIPTLPANILEMGTEAKPYDYPPGPAWNHATTGNVGRITNLNEFALPGLVIDALVEYGLVRHSDRSDREAIKDGIRRGLDILLKDKMIEAIRKHERLALAAESSWGMGR